MDVACHIGAHCTDEQRLLKSLNRNRDRLSAGGIAVPVPEHYRGVLSDLITRLRGAPPEPGVEDALIESMLDGRDARRLVLSNESFICRPDRAVGEGRLYPRMHKAGWIRAAFGQCRVSFHLALRNPATLIPALAEKAGMRDPLDLLDGQDPAALRWSDAVARLRAACPDSPITVWCNEDAPLIWPAVIRDVAGLAPEAPVRGAFDMLRGIMSNEGMRRLRGYTNARPPASDAQQRRVAAAFLDKFALEDEVEVAIDLPGWTPALVEGMTRSYEEDLHRIAAVPDVRVIVP
jgi:hypothetical protein